ncbi:hypothetical protein TELCIR_09666 [Teladorsagia circumcincta]|uniref:Uncharacterized protein n=1 Tax=Teladorsagia circumcincta TaxID=45464 RepID=A0A2G9UE95_TELCI|nr:hypothetical protein TELCIR_09666 [Teladorsagia circumcincta]
MYMATIMLRGTYTVSGGKSSAETWQTAALQPFPLIPPQELNITYPFVPIGTGDSRPPPFSPPQSSFRRGSFNQNRNVPPISLATAAGFVGGDAYVDSTRLQYTKKPLVSAFLTNVCPGPQLAHAVECASSKCKEGPHCTISQRAFSPAQPPVFFKCSFSDAAKKRFSEQN